MSDSSGEAFSKYLNDPFSCECLNDSQNTDFDNFWKTSGNCCQNFRLSLWMIFNVIFLLMVIFLFYKIRKEKKTIQAELEDFGPADPQDLAEESSYMSSNNSQGQDLSRPMLN